MRRRPTAIENLLKQLQLYHERAGARNTHSSTAMPTELAIADIVLALSRNPRVNKIKLDFYHLGKKIIELVRPLLEFSTTMTELDLSYNCLSDEGIEILCEAISANPNSAIKTLHLMGNNIGDCGAAALAKLLKNNAQLDELSLYNNQITALGLGSLLAALPLNTQLKKLDLSNNQISDEHSEAVKDTLRLGLQKNTSLKELDLTKNNIGDRCIRNLSKGIKENTAVQVLSLFDNKITANGIKLLADALTNNKALQELSLGINAIGDEGAKALGSMLQKNRSLLKLCLRYGKINDSGAGHLSEGLKGNNSLWELDLGFNNITDEGAIKLADALKANTNSGLAILHLKKNHINAEGCNRLTALMQTKLSLTIDLEHNEVDCSSNHYQSFKQISKRNMFIVTEENPYKKRKLIKEATDSYAIPSLLELSIFAVKEHVSKNQYNELNLPKHIYRHFLR